MLAISSTLWVFFFAGVVFGGAGVLLALLAFVCPCVRPTPPCLLRVTGIAAWVLLAASGICVYAYIAEFVATWLGGDQYEWYVLLRSHADPFILGPYFHFPPGPYWWAYWLQIICAICPQLFWIPIFRRQPWLILIIAVLSQISLLLERPITSLASWHH